MNGRSMRESPIPGVSYIDLPQVKLRQLGPEALRDDELLAILLWTGRQGYDPLSIAREACRRYTVAQMIDLDVGDMDKVEGFRSTASERLVAGVELAKRGLNQGLGIMPSITNPSEGVAHLIDLRGLRKEHFVTLLLNARNQLISREDIAVGTLNSSLVHPREVFAPAIASSAASMILAHNHPSGDVTPSREDIELTRRMKQAGEILGIEVVDHLIVGGDGAKFLSMREANVF